MPFENYGQLRTNVQKFLDRTDQATTSMIPEFIYLAEKQIMKTLFGALPEIPSLENEIEVEIYPYTDFIDMPADMGRIKYVYLPTKKKIIKVTSYPSLLDMDSQVLEGEEPKFYARHIRRIYFRPQPPTTVTTDPNTGRPVYHTIPVRVVYVRDPVVFSKDTDSSYLLTTCPEILLYGSLAYGYDFIKDLENKVIAEQKMMEGLVNLIAQLKAEDIPDTKAMDYAAPAGVQGNYEIYPYM